MNPEGTKKKGPIKADDKKRNSNKHNRNGKKRPDPDKIAMAFSKLNLEEKTKLKKARKIVSIKKDAVPKTGNQGLDSNKDTATKNEQMKSKISKKQPKKQLTPKKYTAPKKDHAQKKSSEEEPGTSAGTLAADQAAFALAEENASLRVQRCIQNLKNCLNH